MQEMCNATATPCAKIAIACKSGLIPLNFEGNVHEGDVPAFPGYKLIYAFKKVPHLILPSLD